MINSCTSCQQIKQILFHLFGMFSLENVSFDLQTCEFIMESMFCETGADLLDVASLSHKIKLISFEPHFGIAPCACNSSSTKLKSSSKLKFLTLIFFGLCVFCIVTRRQKPSATFLVLTKRCFASAPALSQFTLRVRILQVSAI